MPKRTAQHLPDDAVAASDAVPTLHADGADDDMASEERGEILPGDELQEVDFDVDVMDAKDMDPAFHLLQRWCPVGWGFNLDTVLEPMATSSITSVVKIPDDCNEEELKMLNDNGEHIYGIVGLVNVATLRQNATASVLFERLSAPATTDDVGKQDIGALLTPQALQAKPVALIVSERLANLPPELGAQLHVNLFEELSASSEHPTYEYYVILAKVRLNADKELQRMEDERQALLAAAGGKPVKRKETTQTPTEGPAVSEERSLFTRAEELFYFRHREQAVGLKRFVLDEELSRDVVTVPIVVHHGSLPKLIEDIKTLDSYFAEE